MFAAAPTTTVLILVNYHKERCGKLGLSYRKSTVQKKPVFSYYIYEDHSPTEHYVDWSPVCSELKILNVWWQKLYEDKIVHQLWPHFENFHIPPRTIYLYIFWTFFRFFNSTYARSKFSRTNGKRGAKTFSARMANTKIWYMIDITLQNFASYFSTTL